MFLRLRRGRWIAASLGLCMCVPGVVHAQYMLAPDPEPDPNHSPFEVNVVLDVGITVGAMVLGGLPRLLAQETVRPWCGLDCDPADVNAFDRTSIGWHSEMSDRISTGFQLSSYALPFVLGTLDYAISDPVDGAEGMAKDHLILLETLSVTLVVNNVMGFIVRRPRPITYDRALSDEERLSANNVFSFPSGHVSGGFAMATAYSRIFQSRHPDSPLVVPMWIGLHGLATATGVLRVSAGQHFWTDVIAGGVTGVGLGLLIPWMHEPAEGESKAASLPVRVMPMPLEGGAGLMLVGFSR